MSIVELIDNIEDEDILVDCIKYVLRLGASVDEVTDNWTPLIRATCRNKGEVVDMLLGLKPDLEFNRNDNGETALIYASRHNCEGVVRKLLRAGAEVEAKDNYGWSSLTHVSSEGYVDIVKLLIEYGADVNSITNDGLTPIYWSEYYKRDEITKFLIDAGANS